MWMRTLYIFAARIGLLALSILSTPAAAATFDGAWSVEIITQRGGCDSGARLPIRVDNGTIVSDLAIVKVSGQVTQAGALSVSVGDGLKRASGTGRLTENSGAGTWKGGLCSGIWTAQRN